MLFEINANKGCIANGIGCEIVWEIWYGGIWFDLDHEI